MSTVTDDPVFDPYRTPPVPAVPPVSPGPAAAPQFAPAAPAPASVTAAGGRRPGRLDLSLTQLLGGSLAAATAAALCSQLGLLGTILG
ncbi:MAG: hypothetical protein WB441_09885, partial [Nocardioidaceae bacterium]